jgi:phage repressor protein C with HTH and peptisase S24 domain
MFKLLRVSGNSLLPSFRDGDFALVSRIPLLFGSIREEDVIAFRHHAYGTMIKKIQSVGPNKDEVYVVGTQENSVDSRRFGAISRRDVIGKVIWHIRGTRP